MSPPLSPRKTAHQVAGDAPARAIVRTDVGPSSAARKVSGERNDRHPLRRLSDRSGNARVVRACDDEPIVAIHRAPHGRGNAARIARQDVLDKELQAEVGVGAAGGGEPCPQSFVERVRGRLDQHRDP